MRESIVIKEIEGKLIAGADCPVGFVVLRKNGRIYPCNKRSRCLLIAYLPKSCKKDEVVDGVIKGSIY
jgi:hypothetical protein